MKNIIIDKDEQFIRIKIDDRTVILYPEEYEKLRDNSSGCAADWGYTIRRIGEELIVFHYYDCIFAEKFNVSHFFEVLLKLPVIYVDKYARKKFTLDLASFHRYPDPPKRDHTIMEIINHPHFSKEARIPLYNAFKRGKEFYLQALDKIRSHIENAFIYPDSYRKDEMSFYFDGRNFKSGCGYNGGIIFHNYETNPHYSIHT